MGKMGLQMGSDEPLELGSFVKVKITDAKSYDVYGTCVSE